MFKPELLSPAGTLKNMRYALQLTRCPMPVYAGQRRFSLRVRNNEFNHENLQQRQRSPRARKKILRGGEHALRNAKTFIRDLKPVVEWAGCAVVMCDQG